MTAPGAMALCFRLFEAENLPMRATGFISTVGLVGLAVGPTVGGLIIQVLPWQTLLVLNVPVVVLAAVCIRTGIPADDPADRNRSPLDLLARSPRGPGLRRRRPQRHRAGSPQQHRAGRHRHRVASALTGSLADLDAAGAHSFENAITTATLILTTGCAVLVGWAARRSAKNNLPHHGHR